MKNQLRIIGGEWKRRVLPFANIDGLRPTPDRVRETLFNWLMWDVQNSNVLDLCTGSGALSFEALSRGASFVTMIEPNTEQNIFLKSNLDLLRITNAKIIQSKAQIALKQLPNDHFDLVFLDPPYSLNLWEELASLVEVKLKSKAYIYVETDQALAQLNLPATWMLIKETKAGTVKAGLYQKA